jgi:hypothetical protein
MRRLAVAAVALVALFHLAHAGQDSGRQDVRQSGAIVPQSEHQQAGAAVRLAMGPVSAAHVPGGNGGSPGNYSSQPSDPPPIHHKKVGRLHKHSSRS